MSSRIGSTPTVPLTRSSVTRPVSFGAKPPPLDTELQTVVEDVLQGLKFSFVTAAAQVNTALPPGSVEEAFREAIATRSPERRAAYQAKAQQLASAPVRDREAAFGRYGRLEVDEFARLGFGGTSERLSPLVVDQARVRRALRVIAEDRMKQAAEAERQVETEAAGGTQPRPKIKLKAKPKPKFQFPRVERLGLYITEVRCVDETDGFLGSEAGDDEIIMGGLAIDGSGKTTKIDPFIVGSEFDDGDVKQYSPPGRKFCEFDATQGKDWPKSYAAVVSMAEEDMGGFAAGLTVAWTKASPVVEKKFKAAVADAAEEETGEALAQVFAEIMTWIVMNLVDWILDIFADDIFPPITAYATLSSPFEFMYQNVPGSGWTNLAWPGQLTFTGHGGKYTVNCHWKIN